MIELTVFLLLANQNADSLIEKYRNLQRTIHPLDDFESLEKKIKTTGELLADGLIKKKENIFMEFYLKKVKRDLEIIRDFSPSQKARFSKAYQEFLGFIAYKLKENPYPDGFIVLQQYEANLLQNFETFSFMQLFTENYKLMFTVEFNKSLDFTKAIEKKYKAFEESDWKSNPELSFFLAVLCANAENNSQYEKMIEYAEKYLDILKKNYGPKEIKKIIPQSFLLTGLIKTRNFDSALEIYKKIDKNHFQSINRESSKVFFRIHDSSFELFKHMNMQKDMIESLELKINAMCFFMDKDNEELLLQADLLRRLYYNSNKIELAKKIEAKFSLPNIYKQK